MTLPIPKAQITGLVLAGGQGRRMGGVDKGLQPLHGQPLAWHAAQRLAPQVGALALNANRHLDTYAAWGWPVWPDDLAGQPGPLAGFLAGLAQAATPYLATVPCDSPGFPVDLVARLAQALAGEGAELAVAATVADGQTQVHPVFCLLGRGLHGSLAHFVRSGQGSIQRWAAQHRCATVVFDDPAAFFNANTPADLQHLAGGPRG